MNILFVTGHPAQIHNFRNIKTELDKLGYKTFWIASEKDMSKYLLNHYQIKYHTLPRPGKSFIAKVFTLYRNTIFLCRFISRNKIDIVVSRVSPYACLATYFRRISHIAMTDTESASSYDRFFGRFVSVILTATSYKKTLRKDQLRFRGNIELFYLHPDRFNPLSQAEVEKLLELAPHTPFVIKRFVGWEAFHDKGLTGFTEENKIRAVTEFSKYAKVFISSEKELPSYLAQYQINIPPEKMHDILYYATLFFGEGASMASECAVLGTPAIYINQNWLGYTDEAEKYGLLFSFKENLEDQNNAIQKGIELLKTPDLKKSMTVNKENFLADKINPTSFLVWFIENYPESFRIMKEDPGFQERFK